MPRQTEPSVNNALGNILQRMMLNCTVRSENVRAIQGHPGRQPDILINAAGRAPVIVEAEFLPARGVEDEALGRLGLETVGARRGYVEAVIALRYPADIATADNLDTALAGANLSYCVFTGDESVNTRFPELGWLEGSVSDVADFARLVSLPQRMVDEAANVLENGIERAVALLDDAAELSTTTQEIASLLGMRDVPQTRRMACAVIANAMVFHDSIADRHPEVRQLIRLWASDTDNPQARIAEEWDAILRINYWPIFAIARDIVNLLPSHAAARILEELRETARGINSTGASFAHDLTGRVFQRLIADRKYLATFYTRPASASLLARLAVAKLEGVDWSDAEAIGRLRVGDFACGTGALLSAVYDQIASRHEHSGGDAAALHQSMMENVLYGCDVMPSAVHITSSTLSGIQPASGYDQSRLYNMPYGRQPDGTVAIGSLELLQSSSVMTLFNTSDPAMRTGSTGEETAARVMADIPDEGFDIVIMNPPFTRSTNHGGVHRRIVNPAFAAFGARRDAQRDMGDRLGRLGKWHERPSRNREGQRSCYDGNAGLASAFVAIAHRKLKRGGVLAFVLPLAATVGLSWDKFRQLLATEYADLNVLSIAAPGINEMSFSADTGLGECLIIARKLNSGEETERKMDFVSLKQRPQGFAHSAAIAHVIANTESIRGIEDGPFSGTPLKVGDDQAGEMLRAPSGLNGESWSAARLSDSALGQTAYALSNSRLWLPAAPESLELRMAALSAVGKMGLVHRDINGAAPRGPFDKVAASPTATYPALWNHNASREKKIVFEPDSQLAVRQGMEVKAAEVWSTVSRTHLNLEHRFTSQPFGACLTERESIGGRAWPNVIFQDNRFDYAFTIWCNSTLGLLSFWWHSSLQDSGRGVTTIRSVETMPVLDLRMLDDEQLGIAKEIFDEFRDRELRPAYLADVDENRALLDRRVVCDLLGFREDVYHGVRFLSAKWCAEPSVHGNADRPTEARLVI